MKSFAIRCCHVFLVSAMSVVFGSNATAERPQLQIINGSGGSVDVFWVDSDGKRVSNGTIAAGDSSTIGTTIGHQFVLTTKDGGDVAKTICRQRIQAFRFQRDGCSDLADLDAANPNAPSCESANWPNGVVIPVDRTMNVPSFYSKIIFANRFPIVGSERVDDYALLEAAYLVDQLFAHRDDLRLAMIGSGSRMCIMARDEFTTDLPEHQSLAKASPMQGVDGRDYWDARARGLGGSGSDPYCSCGEENLLGFPGDPYATENILIHEFAHNIHLRGMNNADATFDARLKKTYQSAMKSNLWSSKYASVNHHEYFAEGVQSWFDDNREDDHDHNHVNTRAELIDYDPGLAAMCREVFGDTKLKYTKPATRLSGHMQGYDPASAPTFVWPTRLKHAQKQIRQKAEQRGKK